MQIGKKEKRDDVIMMSLPKIMEKCRPPGNQKKHKYYSKGLDESYPKM